MPESDTLSSKDLGPAIVALGIAMRELGGAIIGGVAISLGTRARMTNDVDAVVRAEGRTHAEFFREIEARGFSFREGYSVAFAEKNGVFVLRHDASGVPVDVSFGHLAFEETAISRALSLEVDGERIPVARPQDLVVMKVFAGRPHDIVDVATLLQAHPDLDRAFVTREIKAVCAMVEDDTYLARWKRLSAETPRPPKR